MVSSISLEISVLVQVKITRESQNSFTEVCFQESLICYTKILDLSAMSSTFRTLKRRSRDLLSITHFSVHFPY
jgi:hypothetical protein